MTKKKFSIDKDSLYQKIMPTNTAADTSAAVLEKVVPETSAAEAQTAASAAKTADSETLPFVGWQPASTAEEGPTAFPAEPAKGAQPEKYSHSEAPADEAALPADAPLTTKPLSPVNEPLTVQLEEPPVETPAADSCAAEADFILDEQLRKPSVLRQPVFAMPINLVEKATISRIKDVLAANDACTCLRCQLDTAAIALNRLPPKYVSPYSAMAAMSDFYYNTHFAEIVSVTLLACQIIKNNPRHDSSSSQLRFFNMIELLVYDKIVSMIPQSSGCQCPYCLSDMAACMLNALEPRYVATEEGILYGKLTYIKNQYAIDLTTQYMKASILVHQHPRH